MSFYKGKPKSQPQIEGGRTFTFRGKELAPFSWNARATLYRLMSERTPILEEYTYLVYLLLTKSPQQMDSLRSDEAISAFRIEAGAWAEKERLAVGRGWEDLRKLASSIVGESQKAEDLEPVPSGNSKPGK